MWKSLLALVVWAWSPTLALALDLSVTEKQWLQAALPVLRYAQQQQIPLDVVVQPQPTPGATPLGMAVVQGRCKLVLSMRNNPQVEATLGQVPTDLMQPVIELIAAHELGHCRRSLAGAWMKMPAGFLAAEAHAESLAENKALQNEAPFPLLTEDAEQRAERREEAYGDLVGLAWIAQHHPTAYARVYAWLMASRSATSTQGSSHDTLQWLKLAAQREAFAHGSLFEAASALWMLGLTQNP
ncbi:MAG: hypothetical protein ACKOF9_17575 [Burkholderiales bacterium]